MNVTKLITLETRLKPGYVKLWAAILDLYFTCLYFDVIFDHCFTATCYSPLDCISTTFRMTRACSVEYFGVTPNWLGSILSGWLGLRRYFSASFDRARVTEISLTCSVVTVAGFSLSIGTTSAQEVDESRDQQILSPTLSPFGYAALRDVNIIQSLWIIILLSDSKSAHHVLLWNQCTFSYNPPKTFARAFCADVTFLKLAGISFRILFPFKGGEH